MKKSWPTTSIGEACTITSGGTPSSRNKSFWNGKIPWVSAKDLKSDCISDSILHISKSAIEQSATKIAPAGSLLMLVRGMGLANGMQIGEVTAPVAFNQDIRAIHPPSNVLPRFLLLALRNPPGSGARRPVRCAAVCGWGSSAGPPCVRRRRRGDWRARRRSGRAPGRRPGFR
jgi:hypothetical protein